MEPGSGGSARDRIRDGYRVSGLLDDHLLDEDLSAQARVRPDAAFLVDGGGDHRFGEVFLQVGALAGALRQLGVGRGDVVSFQLPNRVEAAVTYYATLLLGAISNPIVPIYRDRELAFVIDQAKPKVVVVPRRHRGIDYVDLHRRTGRGNTQGPALVVVEAEGQGIDYRECLAHDPVGAVAGRRSSDPAVLLYTSGTTASPKGVLHSHQTLRFECRSIIDQAGLLGSDIVFMASPLTHVTGLLYGVQLPAMIGASSVLQENWDPPDALRLIKAHRCTFTVGATPFLHGLVEAAAHVTAAKPEALRCFVCGGADVPPELVSRAKVQLGVEVVRAYGLSELPTVTCGGLQDRFDKRAQTDGRPHPAARVRVRDEAGAVHEHGIGELEAIAPELFLGYLDSSLDAAAFTDDGWFKTGDVALVDADGYVTIRGRIKDIIVRGGENISAKEVEDILFEHPDISEVAVVGIPDPVMGQRMCAFIVAVSETGPTTDDLAAFLDQRGYARQKAPERVEIIDMLPKTPSGKVQKHLLRQWAVAGRTGSVPA